MVVYDQLSNWKVGEFDPLADFTYLENSGVVSFTNTSLNAESYAWHFGDTNTSTDENPIHTYTQVGDYEVELVVAKCGVTHTYSTTVSVSSLSIEDAMFKSLKLFPNPTQHNLKIEGITIETIQSIKLFNLLGKPLTVSFNKTESTVDMSALASGNYFLEIITKDGAKAILKVLKN